MNILGSRHSILVAVAAFLLSATAIANAPSGRYTMPAAGIVFDGKTKLTWQQVISGTYPLAKAKTYCAGLSLGGSGWRVPTLKELLTIVDYSQQAPSATIDPTAFPGTPATAFWSSTPDPPTNAWIVAFNGGQTTNPDAGSAYSVRCVR